MSISGLERIHQTVSSMEEVLDQTPILEQDRSVFFLTLVKKLDSMGYLSESREKSRRIIEAFLDILYEPESKTETVLDPYFSGLTG